MLQGIRKLFYSVDTKTPGNIQKILDHSLVVNRWFSWLRLSSFIILSFGFDLFGPISFLSVMCLLGCGIVCAALIFLQKRSESAQKEGRMNLESFSTTNACDSKAFDSVNAGKHLSVNQYLLHIFNFGLFTLGLFKGGDLLLNALSALYGPSPIWLPVLVFVGLCLTFAWIVATVQFTKMLQFLRVGLHQLFNVVHTEDGITRNFDELSLSRKVDSFLEGSEVGAHFNSDPYVAMLGDQGSRNIFIPTKRLEFFDSYLKNKMFRALILIAFLGFGYAICMMPGPWQSIVPAWSVMMNRALSLMVLSIFAGVVAWYDCAPNSPRAAGCFYGLYAFGVGMMVSFGMLSAMGVAVSAASAVCSVIISLLYALNYGYFEYQRDLLDCGKRVFYTVHYRARDQVQRANLQDNEGAFSGSAAVSLPVQFQASESLSPSRSKITQQGFGRRAALTVS